MQAGITVVIGYKQNEGKNGFCSRTPEKVRRKQMQPKEGILFNVLPRPSMDVTS
jgi:hypothetical protein